MNGNTRHTPLAGLPFHPSGKPFRDVAGKGTKGIREGRGRRRKIPQYKYWRRKRKRERETRRDNPGLKASGEVVWGQVDVQINLEAGSCWLEWIVA